MKTITFTLLLFLSLMIIGCAPLPNEIISGSSASGFSNFAVYPANPGATISPLTVQDRLFFRAVNASEKNFSVYITGFNGTNASFVEVFVLNGSLTNVTNNNYLYLTQVRVNQTTTQGFTILDNSTRSVTVATIGAANTNNYVVNSLNNNGVDFLANFTSNTSSIYVPSATEYASWLSCEANAYAINVTTFISPNNIDWLQTGGTRALSCNGNTTKIEFSDKGVFYVKFQVENTGINNTRGSLILATK